MKISIIQTSSEKGKISCNIENHLAIITKVIASNVDLIIFPELSITGYEPELAHKLVCEAKDSIFEPFQKVADETETYIGVGMPTKACDGINISMIIFQPNKERIIYSKQLLHEDELPYFVSGKSQSLIRIKGKRIALGICYETMQRKHIVTAAEKNAEIYIASVAKPARNIAKAYLHFPKVAKEFKMPILMSNCVGPTDNFIGSGKSSIWNKKGILIGQLDTGNEGFLIYNTENEKVETYHI